MQVVGFLLFLLDALAALAVIAAFPVISLTEHIRPAICLLSTGLVLHFVLHNWFRVEPALEMLEDDENSEDDFDDDTM